MKRPLLSGRNKREPIRRSLVRGEAVRVPCKLRRTSARGWGPWTDAHVDLPAVGGIGATWHADDPIAVGFPITRGPVDEAFTDITDVLLRTVRFQTEAFFGKDAEIVVLVADPSMIELAVPADESGPLAERLGDLLLG